jgi:hypothetical protein
VSSEGNKSAGKLKGWLVTGATAVFVVGAIYAFQAINNAPDEGTGGSHAGETPVSDAGARHGPLDVDGGPSLRDELLHATAAQLGVKPLRGVWGVLMERGYAKGVATVVGLADGTASLYIPGGAVTGGKSYAPARLAAMRLVDSGAELLTTTIPADGFPAPAKGRVRFYVLTEGGVRTAEGDLGAGGAADGGAAKLAPLVEAGDALVEALKEATSKGAIR